MLTQDLPFPHLPLAPYAVYQRERKLALGQVLAEPLVLAVFRAL